jgi:hypothetical protein
MSALSHGRQGHLYRRLSAKKMCAMADMVLSYSCHAPLRRYELSARAAGATACMRVRVWHMVRRGLRDCLYMYLRAAICACGGVLASTLCLRHRSVTADVNSAWH